MSENQIVTDEYLLEQNKTYMIVTYAIFLIAMFSGGLISIVGVILAYVKRKEVEGSIYHDHLNYLIRTFWGYVIGGIVCYILVFVLIGYLGFILLGIWYLFRVVYGFIQLLNKQSVTPDGWFK